MSLSGGSNGGFSRLDAGIAIRRRGFHADRLRRCEYVGKPAEARHHSSEHDVPRFVFRSDTSTRASDSPGGSRTANDRSVLFRPYCGEPSSVADGYADGTGIRPQDSRRPVHSFPYRRPDASAVRDSKRDHRLALEAEPEKHLCLGGVTGTPVTVHVLNTTNTYYGLLAFFPNGQFDIDSPTMNCILGKLLALAPEYL